MALNHGINTYKTDTEFSTAAQSGVGIPFYIGCWPIHLAGKTFAGKPELVRSFADAVALGGYSNEWKYEDTTLTPKWTLCEAMYSQFKLFGVGPAIVYNLFNPSMHCVSKQAETVAVSDHVAVLAVDAIIDYALVVKDTATTPATLVKGTDYNAMYDDNGHLVIELISTSSHYNDEELSIACHVVSIDNITASTVSAAVEQIELCKAMFNIVPDLICVPGWSQTPSVAQVMAAKAASINGVYRAKAVVDLKTSQEGASDYSEVLTRKNTFGYTDENMIVCWPLAKVGNDVFDLSVIVCGAIGANDAANGNCPYESPSNKALPITGACVWNPGDYVFEELTLTFPQADTVSYSDGVVTVISNGGWYLWGNYMGCYPTETDTAKKFICTSRTMDWLCNSFVSMFWNYIDRPLTRVTIDAIVNAFNSFLAGLVHEGKLYGGEIQYVEDNNPTSDLIAGKFRLDARAASPVPAQEIDMYVEYDIEYLTAAFKA